jgi:hypothetical protein
MFKITSHIFISLLLIVMIVSCKKKVEKKIVDLKREIFIGIKQKLSDDSLIGELSSSINIAFQLEPIERTKYKNEIRVYFFSAFQERFFIEKQSGDSIIASLFNCKTSNSNDSLFMKIGTSISVRFMKKWNQEINSNSIPALQKYYKDNNVVLDGSPTYFYQIKKGAILKSGIIDNPFELAKNNTEATHISNFINQISGKYSFDFKSKWKDILVSFYPK